MVVKFTYEGQTKEGARDKKGPVRVTSTSVMHTSSCIPSPNQLVVARKASGQYSKLPEKLIVQLLTLLEHNPGTSTHALRAMVREYYPKRSAISAQDIFNLKVRLRLLYEEVQDKGSLAEYKICPSLCRTQT